MAEDFKVRVGAEAYVDNKKVQTQINNQAKNLVINVDANLTNIQKQINNFAKTQKDVMSSSFNTNGLNEYTKLFDKAIQKQNSLTEQAYKINEQYNQKLISSEKQKYLATERAYKINEKMSDSIQIVSTKANAASKSFETYTSKLKSKALTNYSSDIESVSEAFQKAADSGKQIDLTKANAQLSEFKAKMKNAGMETADLTQTLKDNVAQFAKWYLVSNAVTTVVSSILAMVGTVVELDKSLVDLQMATGETRAEAGKLLNTYIEMGQQLGATGTEVAAAASDYLRQGKSIADTNKLITDSIVLSKIGQLDSADATTFLTTAMKGYGVAVDNVIGIVDKLSSVDMASATSAGGLATAMAQTATNANMAGRMCARPYGDIRVA